MRLNGVAVLLLALVFLVAAGPLEAGLIYSNFGFGDSYDASTGWAVGSPGVYQDVGFAFTPGSSFVLEQIDFAAG